MLIEIVEFIHSLVIVCFEKSITSCIGKLLMHDILALKVWNF